MLDGEKEGLAVGGEVGAGQLALDGANVVSLALMAGVTWQLGRDSIFEPIPALIALVSLVLLFRAEINPVWLVIGGGVIGVISWVFLV